MMDGLMDLYIICTTQLRRICNCFTCIKLQLKLIIDTVPKPFQKGIKKPYKKAYNTTTEVTQHPDLKQNHLAIES